MPREVTAADVERALAMCPDEWRWGKDWGQRFAEEEAARKGRAGRGSAA